MNPFDDIIFHARSGYLSDTPALQRLLLSPDFKQLTQTGTAESVAMEVQALHYMLERFPLHPEEAPRIQDAVNSGLLRLSFMEISNPFPVLYLVPEHPAIPGLKAAIERNLQSRQFRAAKALLKWRSLPRMWAGFRRKDRLLSALRAQLTWPTQSNPEQAAVYAANCEAIRQMELRIRDTRANRIQRIREIAGLSGGWHDILKDLAMHLFSLEKPAPELVMH